MATSHPYQVRTFNEGIHAGSAPEIVGKSQDGKYVDACNLLISQSDGGGVALTLIKAENLVYGEVSTSGPSSYFCAVFTFVNNRLFELFVDRDELAPPIIRIDGVVHGESENIPASYLYPIQYSVEHSCSDGLVALSDYNTKPWIWDISDIIESYGTGKYFSEYNHEEHTVGLISPPLPPMFNGLTQATFGLEVGTYSYSFRYVNDSGDASSTSAWTPTIAVPLSYHPQSNPLYAELKIIGAAPTGEPTSVGVSLSMRVANLANYSFIEVIRNESNSNQGVGFTGDFKIVARLPINSGFVGAVDFVDGSDNNIESAPISLDELTQGQSSIRRAKAIRFFSKRLVLGNIEYDSREVSPVFIEENGAAGDFVVEKIGEDGYANPQNYAYKKSYQSGEQYKFGVVFFDSQGGETFVSPIDTMPPQAPYHRDPLSANSVSLSVNSADLAPNYERYDGTIGPVYANFSAGLPRPRTNFSFQNISIKGQKPTGGTVASIGFTPLHPTTPSSSNFSGHDKALVLSTYSSGVSGPSSYAPDVRNVNYWAKGGAIFGIDKSSIPDWVSGFSIVRSKRAGKVVAHGLAFYDLVEGDFGGYGGAVTSPYNLRASKDINAARILIPDLEDGFLGESVLNDILANPGNYRIKILAPYGYYSEPFSFNNRTLGADSAVDFLVNAWVFDSSQAGYNYAPTFSDKPTWGDWIGSTSASAIKSSPSSLFTPSSANLVFSEDGFSMLRFTFNSFFFGYPTIGIEPGSSHEPVYTVSIERASALTNIGSETEFTPTGATISMSSLVGLGTGRFQQIQLVGERILDCSPGKHRADRDTFDSYLYVKQNGQEEVWINVTYKDVASYNSIFSSIAAGTYVSNGNIISGAYTTSFDSIIFSALGAYPDSLFFPSPGAEIYVKYDSRQPIRFFGGDVYSSRFFSPYINRNLGPDAADGSNLDSCFQMGVGFPYYRYGMSFNYCQLKLAHTNAGVIMQQELKGKLDVIRQMLVGYISESRMPGALCHGPYYPRKNYVQRPHSFESGNIDKNFSSGEGNVNDNYDQVHPNEKFLWGYGGLKFERLSNYDYAQQHFKKFYTRPIDGTDDKSLFCTRVLWSLPMQENGSFLPSYKTFPALNAFDFEADNGNLNYIWAAFDSKGQNMYLFFDKGIASVLSGKAVLRELTGEAIGLSGSDAFVGEHQWMTSETGMPDLWWRSCADYENVLFFANRNGLYIFDGTKASSLTDAEYQPRYRPTSRRHNSVYSQAMASYFDRRSMSYHVHFDLYDECDGMTRANHIYSMLAQKFSSSSSDYNYDGYAVNLMSDKLLYGSRSGKAYRMDGDLQISGQRPTASVTFVCAPVFPMKKEFMYIKVNSSKMPHEVRFFDENRDLFSVSNEDTFGPKWLRLRDGWEMFIPRSLDGNKRLQEKFIYCQILFKFEKHEELRVTSAAIQYKKID